jgi:hypothetical protein
MTVDTLSPSGRHTAQRPDVDAARRYEQLTSLDDTGRVADAVLRGMAAADYDGEARRRFRRALEDALLASLGLAGRLAPRRPVAVSYRVGDEYALAEVEARAELAGTPALQAPHAPAVLGAPWPRSYAWLRCDRADNRVQVCCYWSVP